ncbi:MAG TPA: hypothetical protein VKU44_06375 [Terriglobia bacterium]|nr:hypothetical protein [Terriglobia bacterium]
MNRVTRWIAAGLLLAVSLTPALAAGANDNPTVPAGSTLRIRLTTTLTSKTNQTGDPFTGQVVQAIVADGKEIIPVGSLVDGHVALIKPAGRIKTKAEMRIVVDHVVTPDDVKYNLAAGLADGQTGPCTKTGTDEEGTVKGCGKSKKDAAKDSALAGAMGAGAGASVGMGHVIDCEYYGNCGGPGMGTDVLAGAGIGAGTALIYNLFKKEKEVILIEGSELTFVVNRTANADEAPAAGAPAPAQTAAAEAAPPQAAPAPTAK